jgi:cytochrome c peroxidase
MRFAAVSACFFVTACGGTPAGPQTRDDELRERFALEPIGAIQYPADNQLSQPRIALGRLLFFDPILGGEQDVACGTCHHPDFEFTDARQHGAGVSGVGLGPDRYLGLSAFSGDPINTAGRNTPTILNTAFIAATATDLDGNPVTTAPLFWDGRANSLEEQALMPIGSRVEMRGDAFPGIEQNDGYLPGTDEAAESTVDSILLRIRDVPEYVALFRQAFPTITGNVPVVSRSTLSRAIAAYERELVAVDSPFDRWVAGDDNALSELQKTGLELFFTGANCSVCHRGPMLSTFHYAVTGVPYEGPGHRTIAGDDLGREEHTGNPSDRYKFRVPSLRNVEISAPYMHSGVFETLEEVVRFYNDGIEPHHINIGELQQDAAVRDPLGLSDEDITALVDFLRSLTDRGVGLDVKLRTVPATVPSGLMPVYGLGGH